MHEINVLGAILGARKLRTHSDLFHWLQRDVAKFVPHDILIAAWGDFSSGRPCLDVVSPLAGMRTTQACCEAVLPLTLDMFQSWAAGGFVPFAQNLSNGIKNTGSLDKEVASSLDGIRSAIAHGIKDERGWQDCFYVALSVSSTIDAGAVELIGLMMPYIDAAFRQVALLPMQRETSTVNGSAIQGTSPQVASDVEGACSSLSSRELEIMHWVSVGKTNPEIGQILGISPSTVRNHLQRIFRKLDVMNRAQAVHELEQWAAHRVAKVDGRPGDIAPPPQEI